MPINKTNETIKTFLLTMYDLTADFKRLSPIVIQDLSRLLNDNFITFIDAERDGIGTTLTFVFLFLITLLYGIGATAVKVK